MGKKSIFQNIQVRLNTYMHRLHINRKHKDRLFYALFGQDKEALLQLYNALHGSAYTAPGLLTVVTLDKKKRPQKCARPSYNNQLNMLLPIYCKYSLRHCSAASSSALAQRIRSASSSRTFRSARCWSIASISDQSPIR